MEHQACAVSAIQPVSGDGSAETERVCGMDAKLMGETGARQE